MTGMAMLAGRLVPTATATTYVHGDRYLDAVCRANRAEARAEAAERELSNLRERLAVSATPDRPI